MSTMTAERYRHDIALARQANLNALLPFGNVERREFYDLCDEQGILITQYLSMQYRYRADRSFLHRAEQVLAETVALLDPHPSVITWIMNGEPDLDTHLALDLPLAERCRTLDPSRPVQVSSFPIMPLEYGNEDRAMHDWLAKFCHYTGAIYRDLGATGSHSLVAEFGQQSLPSLETLRELGIRQAWPPDWEVIQEHNGCPDELCLYEHERPPAQTIEELIEATQRYQGEAIRYYIDHFRCHRGDWCHALFQFHLVDSWPAVTWSVADYARRPKASYGYLQEAFEPFTLAPDCPPVFCLPGETLEVPLYVINDGPRPVQGQAHIAVYDNTQRRLLERTHNVEVDANSSRWVDTLRWEVPGDAQEEIHSLHLALKTVEGRFLARRPYRILVRSGYAIPLADPDLARAGWSWHRHEEGDARVTYERENDRCFARLRTRHGRISGARSCSLCYRPGPVLRQVLYAICSLGSKR
jgi:beta-mannosidase